jgi:3-oxoacyl-[acyl-carrier-protein] synthase-3
MIGIEAIGSYLPEFIVDNVSRAHSFQTDSDFIIQKIGFEVLRRKEETEETSDLCVAAWKDLCRQTHCSSDEIECIIVCTQNPDGFGLPHTSAIVQNKIGCPTHIAAFDVSLGCSGYVYGIAIIQAFMAANNMKKGLLFTADPYSKALNPEDRNTELLFSDAATCTLFSATPRYAALKSCFSTDGAGAEAIQRKFPSGILEMKGQDVFMFAMKKVPAQIQQCLLLNETTKNDIDIFLFHQGSRYIVENLRNRLALPAEKAPFLADKIGNTVSSSIPLSLQATWGNQYNTILLSGFGVGLSWATTILQQQK